MGRNVLLLCIIGLFPLIWFTPGWAQCPQDKVDLGKCDTLQVVALDTKCDSFPCFVRVLVMVTHDANEVERTGEDSIAAFVIPLAWTHTNPSAYCSVSEWWNKTYLAPFPSNLLQRSIFRHLETSAGDTIFNRMMTLSARLDGSEWDTRILNLDGTSNFWLSMYPTGAQDQRWWEGERVLLATLTFKVEDKMKVCIDTTFWAPTSRLTFVRSDAQTYVPRDNMPYCFSISSK